MINYHPSIIFYEFPTKIIERLTCKITSNLKRLKLSIYNNIC
jgi:hypothetical protein